jgi:hypothetical protein
MSLAVASIGTTDDATRQVIDCAGAITDVGFDRIRVPPEAEGNIVQGNPSIVQCDARRDPKTVRDNPMGVAVHIMFWVGVSYKRGALEEVRHMVTANGVPAAVIPHEHADWLSGGIGQPAQISPGKYAEGGPHRTQVMTRDATELSYREVEIGFVIPEQDMDLTDPIRGDESLAMRDEH